MSSQDIFIFDVSQKSFNTSVILNSYKIPVLVEFMGVWSEPCIRLADQLSLLATEFPGQFIFAKVDIDEQPELQKDYAVENIPTVKVFKDGEVVRTEQGLLNEAELRELLKTYDIFNKSDEMRQQARQQHMAGETMEAIQTLTSAIKQDPSNIRVAMDMIQIMLDIGEIEQATALFNRLPDSSKTSDTGKSLTGQIAFKRLAAKTAGSDALNSRILQNPDDFDAHFDLAICLVADHQYQQAMESLFSIYNKQADYKEGAVKEMIITLCNMLTANEPELAHQYRQKLGSALS